MDVSEAEAPTGPPARCLSEAGRGWEGRTKSDPVIGGGSLGYRPQGLAWAGFLGTQARMVPAPFALGLLLPIAPVLGNSAG